MSGTTHITVPLLSLKDAAKQGIKRLRLPKWQNPNDYIEIHIHDQAEGVLGPWVSLFSPMNGSLWGHNPKMILITEFEPDKKQWLPLNPGAV